MGCRGIHSRAGCRPLQGWEAGQLDPASALPRILRSLLAILLVSLGSASVAWGRTFYVDASTGADAASGLARDAAFRTIGRACELVTPGDSVIVFPGVYFESVQLTHYGTADQPITFLADQLGKNRVIVTGADPAIRNGTAGWQLEDPALELYSTAFDHTPGRALYDELDLFQYTSLDELRSFRLNRSGVMVPGPLHGYFFDPSAQRLYVRLHPSGRYGSTDPGHHLMKFGPPGAAGTYGNEIEKRSDYTWGVLTNQPAHVVLDGFTFETPGFAGVWVQRGMVTIQNCWFRGCRAAVSGWAANDPRRPTADVTIQYCDFTEAPTVEDAKEVIAIAAALSPMEQAALPGFFWWHRKTPSLTSYQGGSFCNLGLRPRILRNLFRDQLDAIAVFAIDSSDGAEIAYNQITDILDNAVECENHARNMRFHHNYIENAFEPFSYQPQSGTPWPASIWIHHNVVYSTPEWSALWHEPVLRWTPGCFKIKVPATFTTAELDGLAAFNNTILFGSGDAFTLSAKASTSSNFHFFNNLIATRELDRSVPGTTLPNYDFGTNIVAPSEAAAGGPGATFAGAGGQMVSAPQAFGLLDPGGRNFALAANSPAVRAALIRPDFPDSAADAGALAVGEPWQMPDAGPRIARQPQLYETWDNDRHPYDRRSPSGHDILDISPRTKRVNLIDYGLGEPKGSTGSVVTSLTADGHMQLSYTRPEPEPLDITYAVEIGDLTAGTWTEDVGLFSPAAVTPLANGWARVTFQTAGLIDQAHPLFSRLRLTQKTPLPRPVTAYPPWVAPIDPQGTIFSSDTFADGNRSADSDPLAMDWWRLSPTNGGATVTVNVVPDPTDPGSGPALFVDNGGADTNLFSVKTIVAHFPSQTLAQPGEQIILTFDFRFAFIYRADSDNIFRFGLYDTRGTRVTQENRSSVVGDDRGYTASVSYGDAAGRSYFTKEAGASGGILQDDLNPLGVDLSSVFTLGVTNVKRKARLAIERTTTGVRLSMKISDASGQVLLEGFETDDNSAFTSFDEIVIATTRMEADYVLDNIRLARAMP